MILGNHLAQRIITGSILLIVFCLSFFYLPPFYLSAALMIILFYILIFEWPKLIDIQQHTAIVATLFYPILPFILLIDLNQSALYHVLFFYLITFVAIHDTASYVTGKIIGKHLIAPAISPKKTWEGFAGGYCCTLIMVLILQQLQYIKQIHWIIVCITVLVFCSVALLGDLFESYLKRTAHIKDSGNLLPGHGGFLDRFDAILFVVYLCYPLKSWIIKFIGK